VATAAGKGRDVLRLLPLSDSASEEKVQRAVEADAPGRILVVEDHPEPRRTGEDPSLRATSRAGLRRTRGLAKAGSFRPES
jgi:hypothetical protein